MRGANTRIEFSSPTEGKGDTSEIYEKGVYMIVAVDFDGVLCEDKFPEIGEPRYDVISAVRQLIDKGHEVVLWTSRVEKELEAAVSWCEDRGLHFTAINENAPSNRALYKDLYKTDPRKIYADVYIDDKSMDYIIHPLKLDDMACFIKKGVELWSVEN